MFNDFSKWMNRIASRVGMLYLLTFLIAGQIFDFQAVKYNIGLATLNRFRPLSFDYFIDLTHGKAELNQDELRKFEFYFQKISEYLPDQADAFGL